jgi:hypothetical protein
MMRLMAGRVALHTNRPEPAAIDVRDGPRALGAMNLMGQL